MIKTIVFDYGRVLAYPTTGNWFTTPDTASILGIMNSVRIFLNRKKISMSYTQALKYMNANHILYTEQEEYEQFIEFYKIFMTTIGFKKDVTDICKRLAYDIVYNDKKVSFYDDSAAAVIELSKKYRVAVLSDTWPSIKRILEREGILSILDGLIMSCSYGITKEDLKLFEIAVTELGITPEDSVFIDDSEGNLDNAAKIGFITVLMDRDNKAKISKHTVVKNMGELKAFIGA